MKRRKEREVKTSTLRALLILFFILWMIILIAFLGVEIVEFPNVVAAIVIYIMFSAIMSLLTLTVMALVLHWRI